MRARAALRWSSLALLLGVVPAAPAAAGGLALVLHHEPERSERVIVPAGTFVMGFAADALLLEDPKQQEARKKERAEEFRERCEQDMGNGLVFVCSSARLTQSASPARRVFLSAFEIDRREVTLAQYRECVDVGVCPVDALVVGDRRYLRPEWPMVNVTWFEAARYCDWRGKRLPSEAEWEKAARGVDGRAWPWGFQERADGGNFGRLDDYVNRVITGYTQSRRSAPVPAITSVGEAADGFRALAPPGSFAWGRSPYGVDDMAGNVREWVADYYSARGYSDLASVNPVRRIPDNGQSRVARGGSWLTTRIEALTFMRFDWRFGGEDPRARRIDLGFRCARDG